VKSTFKHVYANPLQPQVCPILALAMWLSIGGHADYDPTQSARVFPDSTTTTQTSRWGGFVKKFFALDVVKSVMSAVGMVAHFISGHSLRKGSGTSATNCPSGPPFVATAQRAEWDLGMQKRYLKWDAGGDQFVGRTASLLPLNSADFDIGPPWFTDSISIEEVAVLCGRQFGDTAKYEGIMECLPAMLASIVYHEKFLRDTLPPNHPLFSSYVFRTAGELDRLRPHVALYSGRKSGIPAHCSVLRQQAELNQQMLALIKRTEETRAETAQTLKEFREFVVAGLSELDVKVEGIPDAMIPKLRDLMNLKQMQSGEITPLVLQEIVKTAMVEFQKGATEQLAEQLAKAADKIMSSCEARLAAIEVPALTN
jgi:hypothetical protein